MKEGHIHGNSERLHEIMKTMRLNPIPFFKKIVEGRKVYRWFMIENEIQITRLIYIDLKQSS